MIRFPLRVGLAAVAACLSFTATGQSKISFEAQGQFAKPGNQIVESGTRISAGILQASPSADAYLLGAQLLRRSSLQQQRRLKAGLLHDLHTLQRMSDVDGALVSFAAGLAQWLEQLPVTGRILLPLDPRRLELDPLVNAPLEADDRLVFPVRPDHISVVGAVNANCTFPHASLEDADHAAVRCGKTQLADRDWLFLIQPDGQVEEVPVALWNKDAAHALAPGAIIYVPIGSRALKQLDPDFNREFAQFLATQAQPLPGAPR